MNLPNFGVCSRALLLNCIHHLVLYLRIDCSVHNDPTINAGHMNRYLIIPGIIYHLSTKPQKGVTHDHLGQDTEVKLIKFLTQFGYATRKSPAVQLHAAHTHYCSDVNEMKHIQGCDGIHCIIPVTMFLVLFYNACFTFQHDKVLNCSYQG